jgi:hypothetical protein
MVCVADILESALCIMLSHMNHNVHNSWYACCLSWIWLVVKFQGFDWSQWFLFIYLFVVNQFWALPIYLTFFYLPTALTFFYLPPFFCTYLPLIFWSSHLPRHLPLALHFFYVHCCGIRVDVCKGMSRSVNGLFVYKAHNRKGLRMKTNSLD